LSQKVKIYDNQIVFHLILKYPFDSSVESYDPHTNKWTLRAPLNMRRGGVGVAVLSGYLYALGGHDHPANNPTVCRTETVERYCPQTDVWTMVTKIQFLRKKKK
jgi:N-acetylneuraminic acid mutarotase